MGNAMDKRRASLIVPAAIGSLLMGGCEEHVTLHGAKVRHVEVGPVTDLGMVLDEDATPKQVAFALLRAIRDDVQAGRDLDARQKAFQRQLGLCAPDTIYQSYRRFYGSFPVDRDESVYKTVRSWAPTLARYVDAFDFNWPALQERFVQSKVAKAPRGDNDVTSVLLEAADPDGDPNASAVVQVDLTRERGFWRVRRVGFYAKTRHLGRQAKQASKPSDPKASS